MPQYVYRLYHWRDEDNDETYKEIGHYSSREKAAQVIEIMAEDFESFLNKYNL